MGRPFKISKMQFKKTMKASSCHRKSQEGGNLRREAPKNRLRTWVIM